MNDAHPAEDDTLALIDLNSVLEWLSTPPAARAEDDLTTLHAHLAAIREAHSPHPIHRKVIDRLQARTQTTINRLLPELVGVALPLSRRTRQIVRSMQTLLLLIAEDYRHLLAQDRTSGDDSPPEQLSWRILKALACHLQISNYAGAPYTPGIWKMMHQTYQTAVCRQYAERHIPEAGESIEATYLRACLLACAQPASFTSREISLVIAYLERFSGRASFLAHAAALTAEGVFWIDSDRDTPPTSASRRPPPEGALCFSCEQLAQLAEEQVEALKAGARTSELDLPEAAVAPSGHSVLRRLAHHWGHPGKRRFPRRRQNYRAEICIGFPALWQLFQSAAETTAELTNWMVTNESPDGYAVMHVSGKTERLTAGDIVAVRTEHKADWQVCIVRWALSENPEHLELGLQIVATKADAALLIVPDDGGNGKHLQVLALPKLPPLRQEEVLLAPTGTAIAGGGKMILLRERGNLAIREIRAGGLEEQTASIELITFASDASP